MARKKNTKSRKHSYLWWKITGVMIALYSMAVIVNFLRMPQLPIVEQGFLTENSDTYTYEIAYPRITHIQNQQIQTLINQQIEKQVEQVAQQFVNDTKQSTQLPVSFPKQMKSTLHITNTVERVDQRVISLLYQVSDSPAGAAHPTNYNMTQTFLVATGKQLPLSDVFKENSEYLAFLSQYTSNILQDRFIQQGNDFSSFIAEGTAPQLDNFQKFYFTKTALVIVFDPISVAPDAWGTQTVDIPFAKIENMVQPTTLGVIQK